MLHLATYFNQGKPICTTRVQASNAEEAEIIAGFKIACHLPNVEHDRIEVSRVEG